jgi:hypothetical protein
MKVIPILIVSFLLVAASSLPALIQAPPPKQTPPGLPNAC